jgi:Tfp pilus assembly protein PilF
MMTPEMIKKTYAKALAAQQAGRLDEAQKGYARLLKANPKLAEVQFNMGRVAAARRQIAEAATHFEAALRLKPQEPAIWLAYLEMASRHPNIDNLAKLLARAGSGKSTGLDRFAEITFYKGLIAARRNQPQEALTLISEALDKGLNSARARVELGMVQAALDDPEAALASFDAALALSPGNDFAWARKAALLRDTGRTEEALEAAREAIKAAPKQGAHYHAYTSVAKVQPQDPVIAQIEAALKRTSKNDPGRVYLGHALAKAMEDTGQPDKMFRALDQANAQLAKTYAYDLAADVAQMETWQAKWAMLAAADLPEAAQPKGPTPIFVTGMPRSGTTLIEQILASHSDCAGAGELSVLGGLMGDVLAQDFDTAALSKGLQEAGATYLDTLSSRYAGARFVTDKSISSYSMIGFIRHALPQARIIVVRRDPGDNALSLYKNLFAFGTHRYAASLPGIAQFMTLFERQIDAWRAALPDAFSEQSYEALIAEPEAQTRALVAKAGLDWQEACLSFYDTSRKVDTLSSTQVRQPIYSSSVGAWKRHEAEMAPFWQHYSAE